MSEIKAVSNRNNFTPLTELISLYSRSDDESKWLMDFAKHLMFELSNAYTVACQKAMDQASHLLIDPNYAETKRKQTAKRRAKTLSEKKERERQMLIESIDPEAIVRANARKLKELESILSYHKRRWDECAAERDQLITSMSQPKPDRIWEKASKA